MPQGGGSLNIPIGLDVRELQRQVQNLAGLMKSIPGLNMNEKQAQAQVEQLIGRYQTLRDLISEIYRMASAGPQTGYLLSQRESDTGRNYQTSMTGGRRVSTTSWIDSDNQQQSVTVADTTNKIKEHNDLLRRQSATLSEIQRIRMAIQGADDKDTTTARSQLAFLEQQRDKQDALIRGTEEQYKNIDAIAKLEQRRAEMDRAYGRKQEAVQYRDAQRDITENYREQIRIVREMGQIDRKLITAKPLQAEELNNRKEVLRTRFDELKAITDVHGTKKETAKVQAQIARETSNTAQEEKKHQEQVNNTLRAVIAIATALAVRTLRRAWSDATEYVKEYYDHLNEIRIVTGITEREADKLGNTYVRLGRQMSVSSRDIAGAAVEFWRQGLPEAEVNARLEATTRYAKISQLQFAQAAEIMTSATNAFADFDMTANKAADVFSYLGDASAQGADEIGIAMQRASAAAAQFGVEFEWLGAYIAAVSERTRLAPERIGTALNTILSRLYSIRETGFNQEDEVNINQVSKALNEVNISLFDAEGNWRSFSEVMQDLSGKWDTMTDRQRSYIATTMAGVRQQNIFLSLLQDMSKGAEGGSRAFELYEGAINSAGVSMDKYAIYQESMAAAQDRLKLELENMYGLLSADMFKGWYTGIADFIRMLTEGTESAKGMNVVIGLMGALLVSLATKAAAAGGIMKALTASSGLVGIAMFAAISVGWALLSKNIQKEAIDVTEGLQKVEKGLEDIEIAQGRAAQKITEIEKLRNEYIELASKSELTAEEQERLKEVLEEIQQISPNLRSAIEQETEKYGLQIGIVKALNDELREQLELKDAAAKIAAIELIPDLQQTGAQATKKLQRLLAQDSIMQDIVNWMVKEEKNQRETEEETGDRPDYLKDEFSAHREYWRQYGESAKEGAGGFFGREKQQSDALIAAGRQLGIDDLYIYSDMWGVLAEYTSQNYFGHAEQIQIAREEVEQTRQQQLAVLEASYKDSVYEMLSQTEKEILDQAIQDLIKENPIQVNEGEIVSKARIWEAGKVKDEQIKIFQARRQDTQAETLARQVDKAREVYEKESSQANQNTLNALIDQWNDAYGTIYYSLERVAEATIETAAQIEDADERVLTEKEQSEKRYANTKQALRRQEEAKRSERKGFQEELALLEQSLKGTDGSYTDIGAFKAAMDDLRLNTPEKYIAMAKEFPTLNDMIFGRTSGEDAAREWQVIWGLSNDIAENMKNAKEDSSETGKSQFDGMEALEQISQLYTTLSEAALEDREGLLNQIMGDMDDESLRNFLELVPQQADLIQGADNWPLVLEQLSELVPTTYEAIGSALGDFNIASKDADASLAAGIELMESMLIVLQDGENGLQNYIEAWNDLGSEADKKRLDAFSPTLRQIAEGTISAQEGAKRLTQEVEKLKTEQVVKQGKVWSETADVINKVGKNTGEFLRSYTQFEKKIKSAVDAQRAYNYVISETNTETDEYKESLQELSSYTNMAIENADDLQTAKRILAADLLMAQDSAEWLLNTLATMAGVEFDSSTWKTQLAALQNSSDETERAVAALISSLLQVDGTSVTVDDSGTIRVSNLGRSKGLLPSRTGGGGSKRGGGGGGGGGGRKDSGPTEEELAKQAAEEAAKQIQEALDALREFLKMMERKRTIMEIKTELVRLNASYHETRGELTAVNTLLQQEYELVEAQIALDKENISILEEKIRSYDGAQEGLDDLQSAHANYSKSVIQNIGHLEDLKKSMKDNVKAIREMEIDLRLLLNEAAQAKYALARSMLEGRKAMEELIIETIRQRYQDEWELIREDLRIKRDALNEEKRLIDERLRERRRTEQTEDKRQRLADLERQLSLVSADPTRAKERFKLEQDIAKLRKDLSWTTAEDEAQAEKDAIDQQIKSLDDYIQFIEEYYENILKYPAIIAEEMLKVFKDADAELFEWASNNITNFTNMTEEQQRATIDRIHQLAYQTDEEMIRFMTENVQGFAAMSEEEQMRMVESVREMVEDGNTYIIQWLKDNNQNYIDATDVQREHMQQGWTDTLDQMRGITRTHWKEVEEIIKQGDDAILKYLMDHHPDYRNAGALQAQAYLDEWKARLEALKAAYRDTARVGLAEMEALQSKAMEAQQAVQGAEQAAQDTGSPGGGSRGSPPPESTKTYSASYRDPFTDSYRTVTSSVSQQDADAQAKRVGDDLLMKWNRIGGAGAGVRQTPSGTSYISQYSSGGYVDYTGLAMVHGSQSRPEAVLNPAQTQMFQDFVNAMMRIQMQPYTPMQYEPVREQDKNVETTIESITINVGNIHNRMDIERVAREVSHEIMREVTLKMGGPVSRDRWG